MELLVDDQKYFYGRRIEKESLLILDVIEPNMFTIAFKYTDDLK